MIGKEKRRLLNEFETGGFMAQKRSMESRKREKCCRTEVHCPRKKVTLSERDKKRISRAVGGGKMEKTRKNEKWRWTGKLKKR